MRRPVSWLAAAVLLATAWPLPAAGAVLSDMPGHWARTQVEAGVAAGYVAGYPDGTFRPNASITRAEFYKLLGAAMRLEPAAVSTGFAEERQAPVHWSFSQGHVPAAVAGGLLYPSDYAGQFAPDTRVTRREIVVAAVRALGKEPLVGRATPSLNAPDWGKYPLWLQNYAALAVTSRIVTGYEDGSLGLERNATRAEALVIVQRILDQVTAGLTAETGPGDPTAVRHPAEGEPTWTVREPSPGQYEVTNGTAAQDYRPEAGAVGLSLLPAPGRAIWVTYRTGTTGVVGRLSRGQLKEVARYEGLTPKLLAVDDDGRLWYSDGGTTLLVAGIDAAATAVPGVSERLTAGSVDWSGVFWGVGDGRVYRVSPDLQAVPYPLEMQPGQEAEHSILSDDGSLWLLLKSGSGDGPKAEAVHLEYGRVTHRVALLGQYFGGVGNHAGLRIFGRSGPFLWVEARVTDSTFSQKSAGLYRMNLLTGEFGRLVLPREVSAAVTAHQAADGGGLIEVGGRFWRLLP